MHLQMFNTCALTVVSIQSYNALYIANGLDVMRSRDTKKEAQHVMRMWVFCMSEHAKECEIQSAAQNEEKHSAQAHSQDSQAKTAGQAAN